MKMNRTIVVTAILMLLITTAFAAEEIQPVLYFSFDEDSGKEVEDLSGNENHGELPLGGKFEEGKFNMGLSLEGPDTVDVEHSESLDFTDELTVGVWVNLVGTANQKIIGKAPIGSGWVLGVNNGIYPECWDKNGTNHTTTKGTVKANTWTHLALTYSSETEAMVLYIDGVEVGRLNNGGNPIGQTTNILVIGASPWGKDWPSAGIYDDIKLYNVAFDTDQVNTMLMAEGIGTEAVYSQDKLAITWGEIRK
jgi:hypothetical protein